MRKSLKRVRLVAALAAVAVLATPAYGVAYAEDAEDPVPVVDQRTAKISDARIVAKKAGWTVRDTFRHLETQNAFGDLLVTLGTKFPDSYAGAEFAEEPGGTSTVRFKGDVPADATEVVKGSRLPVELIGGMTYSLAELQERSVAIVEFFGDAGYAEVGSAVMADGTIDVALGGEPKEKVELPRELSDGVRISEVREPIVVDEHTRGGARVFDLSDGSTCTSGFAVESTTTGTTGVSTAAHCDGIDQYVQPSDGLTYSLTHQSQHLGLFGDVEWKTSPHIELAEYYASPGELRDVTAVEPWLAISSNSWYCVYSRVNGDRDCDEVYSTFVNALTSSGLVSSLVGMTDDNTSPGDSGGPWSWGTEATGGHRGDQWIWFKYRNVFSVADLFPVAIGVEVLTQ